MHHTIAIIIGLSLLSWSVCAENKLPQEPELRVAFAEAKNAALTDNSIKNLANNPLLPWLKAINLKQAIATATQQQVLDTIGKQADNPANNWLIGQWRTELINRQDWQGVASWQALYPSDSLSTRCALLLATIDSAAKEKWQQEVLSIWSSEDELPKHCYQLIDTLNQTKPLTASQNWQRFDYLLAANQIDNITKLSSRFSGAEKIQFDQYFGFISKAQLPATSWPNTPRAQNVLTTGLKALAKRDTSQAETLFNQLVSSYSFSPEQRVAIQSEIALWSMVNYQDNAEARFFAIPEKQRSANLREWYMRVLFAQNNDNKTLAGFEQLLPEQRNEDRWQYFQARILERLNKPEQAMPLYRNASLSSSYYGWLAADRRQSDYALCPLQVTLDHTGQKTLKNNLSLQRAFMLWQLNEANYAIWEWNAAYKLLTETQKPKAIEMAQQIGWYDRAVFSLESNPVNQRYYTLRFATPYLTQFDNAAAQFNLNRSWLMAHARAESIFMPDVRSSANARGLLQLIPSTAEAIAVNNSIPWQGAESLYQPDVNILLGAGALRNEFNSYPGKAYQAIGAYNAGPTPVNRWQAQRPNLDPDFWIETVTYKETRDYIARVLAFSVIYDWRLNQPIIPISNRMTGDFKTNSKLKFSCPTPLAKN